MPVFYFDVEDGQPALPCEGYHLDNLVAAKCEAIQMAGRIMCDCPDDFWDRAELIVTVSDSSRLTMFTLHITATEAPAMQQVSGRPARRVSPEA